MKRKRMFQIYITDSKQGPDDSIQRQLSGAKTGKRSFNIISGSPHPSTHVSVETYSLIECYLNK